jgi:hypothetical protein
MEDFRLTTTQDMFLEWVGITNSFNDDNEFRFQPFFVSRIKLFYDLKKDQNVFLFIKMLIIFG